MSRSQAVLARFNDIAQSSVHMAIEMKLEWLK
jgi:hypothetical protein